MTRIYRRYFLLVMSLTLGAFALTAATNLIVDPYGLWKIKELRGFNAAKSERRKQAHLFKTFDLRRPLPPVLVIGSSRTAYGIDPEHPALERLGGAYNAAIPGGHLTVVRSFLELALAANPGRVETVIFGADFFDFGEKSFAMLPATFSERRMRPDRPLVDDVLTALLTLDALSASVRTVRSNRRDPDYQPFYANGQFTAIDMRKRAERRGMIHRFRGSLDLYLNHPERLGSFEWSEDAFKEFENIVRICEQSGVELRAFVPPTHAAHLEAIYARDLWEQFEAWKRRIASVTPFWDFSGYNRVTMEPMAETMSNYWDISHYRSGVGDLVLSRMFDGEGAIPADGFGWRVTETNLQAALDAALARRSLWRVASPDVLELIETIIERDE
jgi:hypothetical protein